MSNIAFLNTMKSTPIMKEFKGTGGLSICAWNSRGLSSSVPYLRHLISCYDIICLSEHWLHSNKLNDFELISADIDFFARSSKMSSSENFGYDRGQGGVAVLWNRKLKGLTPLVQLSHDRICVVRVQNEAGAIFNIYSVYMPSKGSSEDFYTTMEYGSLNIVCGDLNAHLNCERANNYNKALDRRGIFLERFINKHNLKAVNLSVNTRGSHVTYSGPTGSSCIDFILVPKDIIGKVVWSENLIEHPLNTSDHRPVVVSINIEGIQKNFIECNGSKRVRWDKMSWADLQNKYTNSVTRHLDSLYDNSIGAPFGPDEIDMSIDNISQILKEGEKAVPRSKYRKNVKPYWCQKLQYLKVAKVKAFREWCAANRPRQPDNVLRQRHMQCKKSFAKKLRQLSKQYREERVTEAVNKSEVDKNAFWRLLKKERDGPKIKTPAVKDQRDVVQHKLEDILEVWRVHFSKLGSARDSPEFDDEHFRTVNTSVETWSNEEGNEDQFIQNPFTHEEVTTCIGKLKLGKTPGADSITTEHVKYAGFSLVRLLTFVFNHIVATEYVPVSFRRGIQIPLYKGKNTSTLDVNNYRGITLLSTFEKLFEALLWSRLKPWWEGNAVISKMQGACRTGVSCLHTALTLQETISHILESKDRVYVLYLDVAKAFDSIWINGLFYRLRNLGIVGKTWRILFNTYTNFQCCVRIQGELSEWYPMTAGIHQGGYLSLLKYIAFIDSLIVELENSNLCCSIQATSVSPLGYADDLAAACTGKLQIDRTLNLVFSHSRRWRYDFNPKKSAVLVYGESNVQRNISSKFRTYRLGYHNVYDHVGLKTDVTCINNKRTNDKVSKGRRTLNAASGVGFRPGGLTLRLLVYGKSYL